METTDTAMHFLGRWTAWPRPDRAGSPCGQDFCCIGRVVNASAPRSPATASCAATLLPMAPAGSSWPCRRALCQSGSPGRSGMRTARPKDVIVHLGSISSGEIRSDNREHSGSDADSQPLEIPHFLCSPSLGGTMNENQPSTIAQALAIEERSIRGKTIPTVNLRRVWEWLEVQTPFSMWADRRI
jgi:hypothetical protein